MKTKKIKVLFSYWESVIPKRCRNAREVRFDDGEITLSIPSITASQAPVAIIKPACFEQAKPIHYLWWNDQLWTPTNASWYGDDQLPEQLDIRSGYRPEARILGYSSVLACPTKEKVITGLQSAAQDWLLIDGAVYRVTSEPRYYAITFGLGRNHAGTSLSWSSHYNPNIVAKSYFSLLQKEEAIARTTQIAIGRGDTNSLPIEAEEFEVLIPEAIKLNPAVEHGDGCEFLNGIEAMAQASGGNQLVVAATAMSLALGK